jgi:hypothetical protein
MISRSEFDAEKAVAYAANLEQFSRYPAVLTQAVPEESTAANFLTLQKPCRVNTLEKHVVRQQTIQSVASGIARGQGISGP